MENEKIIQIKIEGNNCIVNYPDESQITKSKISGQTSLCGSLTNIDDLNLTISKTTEDFINNNNNNQINLNYNNNNINSLLNTNEKSKLEITYISIFNSDKKSEYSSNTKTPIYHINNNQNINEKNYDDISIKKYEKDLKDSVIKKLNFDLCDSIKETETIKKNPEINKSLFKENISKNLNERYFMHEKNINNNSNSIYSIYNQTVTKYNNNDIENENNKSKNIVINSFEDISKNENSNEKYITVNKSLKYFKNRCKSFHKEKKINNRITVDSNASTQNNKNSNFNQEKNILVNINNNLFHNNSSSKINVNRSNYLKKDNFNDRQSIKYDKYMEKKDKLQKYFDKLCESKPSIKSTYLKLKTGNNLTQLKEQNINQLIKIEENLETESKIINNITHKEYIMNTTKKVFPQLSSTNSFNTSNSKNKLNCAQLSSVKKSYYFQTPSTSNFKAENSTASTQKDGFSSNYNSPITTISSSKLGPSSRIDKKEIITKLYYNNSSSKISFQNNKNKNENIINAKFERKKSDFIIDREKEVTNYFLKRHNTDLKNVMNSNNKKIQTILNDKNINNHNIFNNNNNNGNKINEINEFKQFIQKNQFDKELLKTIKKRGSFH